MRLCGVPQRSKNSLIISFAKCDPRSDLIMFGEPNRPKCASKQSAADLASASAHQNNSVHRVNVSMMTRTYSLSGSRREERSTAHD